MNLSVPAAAIPASGAKFHAEPDSIATDITAMATMPLHELRDAWQQHHPRQIMPAGLPRDLLIRSIVWQVEAQRHRDMPKALKRRLEALSAQLGMSGDLDLERSVRLKPGTHIVREWRERTYRVVVLDDGYLFEDRRYASLSHVARAITGTRWSGPRFFGLKQRTNQRSANDA